MATLWLFCFVVTAISSNGAAENRALFKDLATISIKDLVDQQKLPTSFLNYKINSFKIVFLHPHYKESNKDILIFIQSDMPHIMKNFANVFEQSRTNNKTTDLIFKGEKLSLMRSFTIWYKSENQGNLRNSSLQTEHFLRKDSHNQMRAFLAFQVCSTSMVELVKNYDNEVNGIDNY